MSMASERRETDRKERGQSLVELALTLPLVLLIIMGIIEFGFVLYANVQVAAASGQGARVGSLFRGDQLLNRDTNDADRETAIEDAVSATLGTLNAVSPNFSAGSDVQISYPEYNALNVSGAGEKVQVRVQYRQPLHFNLLPNSFLLGSVRYFTVSSTTTMRIQ